MSFEPERPPARRRYQA